MRPLRLTVRRSIPKTFLLGLLGLPLLFVALDYIWGFFGFLDIFGRWSYGGGEVEAFEARDDILVALLGLLGLALVLFALKEFVAPRRLLVADDDGIRVHVRGPFRGADGISWYQLKELRAEDSHLLVEVVARGDLPSDPWNARWDDSTTLRLRTTWWDRTPENALGRMKALGFRPLLTPAPPADDLVSGLLDEPVADDEASMPLPDSSPVGETVDPLEEFDRLIEDLVIDDTEEE